MILRGFFVQTFDFLSLSQTSGYGNPNTINSAIYKLVHENSVFPSELKRSPFCG